MATAKRAETAKEFKEKYGNKRFTSSNAWRIVIFNYIYTAYQIEEGIPGAEAEELYPGHFQKGRSRSRSAQDIVARIDRQEDALRYNAFVHLQQWTETAFRENVFLRNNLFSVIRGLFSISSSIIVSEQITTDLGNRAEESDIFSSLAVLSLKNHLSQSNANGIRSMKRNITLAIRHITAYNRFIELVASAMKIPEFTVFQVEMANIQTAIQEINKNFSLLTTTIQERIETEDGIREALTVFEPIEEEPDPIPESNIKKTKDLIFNLCQYGRNTWTNAFSALCRGYWRQV